MKRRFLRNNGLGKKPVQNLNDSRDDEKSNSIQIPENLQDYAHSLCLLNDIPLTYLLTDVADLPPESIRFGIIDENWIDAYIDGAFSIGRVCNLDTLLDKSLKNNLKKKHKLTIFNTPRMRMMHKNHIKSVMQNEKNIPQEMKNVESISVVLIRSELIKNQKELHFSAYDTNSYDYENVKPKDNASPLYILRIEKISSDIMICLFSGILDVFIIDEPKTGLKFGGKKDGENINFEIRSIEEDDKYFGNIRGTLSIDSAIIDEHGKIHAKELATQIETAYNGCRREGSPKMSITSSIFAYEMLSIPYKAVFDSNKFKQIN